MKDWRIIYNPKSCEKLLKYKNIHLGEDCIIMGSSPTLQEIPHSFLEKYKVIGVNATPFYYTPNYITSLDLRFSWFPKIRDIARENKIPYFIKWACPPHKALFNESQKVYYENEIHLKNLNITANGPVEKDILTKLNNPEVLEKGTGSHKGVVQDLAIPLAFYMGFDKVYLAGIDFPAVVNTDKPRFYEGNEFSIKSDEYANRRWSIELIGQSNKKERVFSLSSKCSIKCLKYIDYKDI